MILFQSVETRFSPAGKRLLRSWIKEAIHAEQLEPGTLNYIFCDDNYLLSINRQFLNHDDYTDIITFDYRQGNVVAGDIFISIPRVKENAIEYGVSMSEELHRVMIHGVLHLCGYKDKKAADKSKMTSLENKYLLLRPEKLVS